MINAPAALADAAAVIPTSPNPGTSPNTINNYQQVTLPANDDGTWPCGGDGNAPPPCPGPGGQTGPTTYPLGFNINFFGTEYNSAYINNNGNITFGAPLPTYTPTDLTTFANPIVAPFFADVDTRGSNSALVNFGTGTLNGQNVFVVNWPGVGCYNQNSTVLDNFQLIIIDRPDRGTGSLGDDFDMEFNYNSIQWDTGQASGGDGNCQNGPAGNTAYVGYSNGTATPGDSYTLPGSGVPQSFLDSSTSTGLIYNDLNSTTLGRYLFTVNNGQPTAPTSLSTSLSGGGQSGTSISVPAGTNVTDAATLTGANAASATGTVTYNVYSDSSCTNLVSGGSPQNITTPGTLPGSQPVSLTTPGTYYWQAVYSGDSTNNGSISACAPTGSGNEVETVTAAGPTPTTLASTLSGGGQSGAQITVPAGTAVTDSATVAGANAATASGTVTYSVYSDSSCTNAVSTGSAKAITDPGTLPSSDPVTLTSPGTYYWQVSYSGDSLNNGSVSSCGAEKETVAAVGKAPKVGSSCHEHGTTSVTDTVTTTQRHELVVAYVTAAGPAAGGQSVTVAGSGLTWTQVAGENSSPGDAEVWEANAGAPTTVNVTATASKPGYHITQTAIAYKNATGIGASGTFNSASGAPTGSITTTQSNSWVWGVGFDGAKAIKRTVGSGQKLFSQNLGTKNASWVQSTLAPTPAAGTSVTINDVAPTADPYNLVLVEIR